MNATGRMLLLGAAMSGFLTVALGAFGAHALRGSLSQEMLSVWQTAVLYQGLHSLALLAIGLLALQIREHRWIIRSGGLMLLGILLFSGSLYLMALSNYRPLGMVTPFGGLALLSGWAMLAYALYRQPPAPTP